MKVTAKPHLFATGGVNFVVAPYDLAASLLIAACPGTDKLISAVVHL